MATTFTTCSCGRNLDWGMLPKSSITVQAICGKCNLLYHCRTTPSPAPSRSNLPLTDPSSSSSPPSSSSSVLPPPNSPPSAASSSPSPSSPSSPARPPSSEDSLERERLAYARMLMLRPATKFIFNPFQGAEMEVFSSLIFIITFHLSYIESST